MHASSENSKWFQDILKAIEETIFNLLIRQFREKSRLLIASKNAALGICLVLLPFKNADYAF